MTNHNEKIQQTVNIDHDLAINYVDRIIERDYLWMGISVIDKQIAQLESGKDGITFANKIVAEHARGMVYSKSSGSNLIIENASADGIRFELIQRFNWFKELSDSERNAYLQRLREKKPLQSSKI